MLLASKVAVIHGAGGAAARVDGWRSGVPPPGRQQMGEGSRPTSCTAW